jgi:large repetitive protein
VPTFSDASFSGCTPSTLPSGVTFTAAGLVSGTPGTGTTGSYTICVTAANSVLPNATQKFTLTVDQLPVITSASSTTFAAGTAGTFTATATGIPTPTFSNSSFGGCTPNLPSGVSFSNPGGVLSGTPGASAGGTYTVCINATNAVGTATQNFTLTVTQLPAVSSPGSTAFTVGTAGSFQATATGYPAPTFSNTAFAGCTPSTLPSGVTVTNAGLISGTPAAGTGGSYTVCIKATNSVGSGTQTFTLTVDQAPVITSASSTGFTVGTAGTFSATATGTPAATFSNAAFAGCAPSTLPSGITFSGAGALSGTPGSGSAGTYTVCINATNGAGSATPQKFTLTIGKFTPAVSVAGSRSGTTLTFTVTVTGTDGITPTGTPTWTMVSTPGGSVSCSSSTSLSGAGSAATATCTYNGASGSRQYTATATYPGNTNYATNSGTSSAITG